MKTTTGHAHGWLALARVFALALFLSVSLCSDFVVCHGFFASPPPRNGSQTAATDQADRPDRFAVNTIPIDNVDPRVLMGCGPSPGHDDGVYSFSPSVRWVAGSRVNVAVDIAQPHDDKNAQATWQGGFAFFWQDVSAGARSWLPLTSPASTPLTAGRFWRAIRVPLTITQHAALQFRWVSAYGPNQPNQYWWSCTDVSIVSARYSVNVSLVADARCATASGRCFTMAGGPAIARPRAPLFVSPGDTLAFTMANAGDPADPFCVCWNAGCGDSTPLQGPSQLRASGLASKGDTVEWTVPKLKGAIYYYGSCYSRNLGGSIVVAGGVAAGPSTAAVPAPSPVRSLVIAVATVSLIDYPIDGLQLADLMSDVKSAASLLVGCSPAEVAVTAVGAPFAFALDSLPAGSSSRRLLAAPSALAITIGFAPASTSSRSSNDYLGRFVAAYAAFQSDPTAGFGASPVFAYADASPPSINSGFSTVCADNVAIASCGPAAVDDLAWGGSGNELGLAFGVIAAAFAGAIAAWIAANKNNNIEHDDAQQSKAVDAAVASPSPPVHSIAMAAPVVPPRPSVSHSHILQPNPILAQPQPIHPYQHQQHQQHQQPHAQQDDDGDQFDLPSFPTQKFKAL